MCLAVCHICRVLIVSYPDRVLSHRRNFIQRYPGRNGSGEDSASATAPTERLQDGGIGSIIDKEGAWCSMLIVSIGDTNLSDLHGTDGGL